MSRYWSPLLSRAWIDHEAVMKLVVSVATKPLILEKLQPTAEEMEQWYWMVIDDDITQGFVYGCPQDANPPVNLQTREHRRTGTA
ncbi:hypothetical protein Dimus_026552 [Dionaea muscipula]